MADSSYVVEVILRARNQMGSAIAAGVAELKAMEKATEESRGKVQQFAQSMEGDLRKAMLRYQDASRGVRGENEKLVRDLRDTQQAVKEHDRSWEGATQTLEKHSSAAAKLDTQLNRQQTELRKAEQSLKSYEAGNKDAGRSVQDLERRIQGCKDRLDETKGAIRENNAEMEKYTSSINRNAGEVEKLNRLQSEQERRLKSTQSAYDGQIRKLAEMRRAQDELRRSMDDTADPRKQEVLNKEFDRLSRNIRQAKKETVELDRQMSILTRRPHDLRLNLNQSQIKAELRGVGLEVDKVARDRHMKIEADVGAAVASMKVLDREVNVTDRDVNSLNRSLRATGQAGAEGSGISSLSQLFQRLSGSSGDASSSVAQFDNTLRGLLALAVTTTLQALDTVVIGLAGDLVAVASSAVGAGAALGGALTAGAAQAIPAIGLLAASFHRLTQVMAAVQQHNLVSQQQSYQNQKASADDTSQVNSLANAQDTLRGAMEGVIQAHLTLTQAQQNLTRARFDASRQLQDLIFQERSAALAAKGAALDQAEAQQALQSAITSGDVSGLSAAELAVQSSNLQRRTADEQARRARQDLALQERGAVTRPDTSVEDAQRGVADARRGLVDAQRAVEQARRGIETARHSVANATNDFMASAGKFDYLYQNLSKAEKGLYQAILRLQQVYKETFRPITDIIVNSFTGAVEKVTKVIQDPRIVGSFTSLAHSIAGAIDEVTNTLTSNKFVKFFSDMAREAGQNIKPLTDTFVTLLNTFRHIAVAASPVFSDILHWISQGAKEFEHWVGHGKDLQRNMSNFEGMLQAWLRLLGAISRLFLALVGSSAKQGTNQVRELTGVINEATLFIVTHQREVAKFFRQVGVVAEQVGSVLLSLGGVMLHAFNPKASGALADLLNRVLIPALGRTFEALGQIIIYIDDLARKHPELVRIGQAMIGIGLGAKVAGGFLSLLSPFGAVFGKIAGGVQALEGAMGRLIPALTAGEPLILGLSASTVGWAAAIAILVAGFIYLANKFGVLDDILGALKQAFQPVTDAFKQLGASLANLGRAFGLQGDDAKVLGTILRATFVGLVMGVIVPAIKVFGIAVDYFIARPIRVVAEVIQFFADLIHGRFGAALGDLGNLFMDTVGYPIKVLIGLLKGPFGAAINGVVGFFRKLSQSPVFQAVQRVITAPFRLLITIVKDILAGIRSQFSNLIHFFDDLFHGRFGAAFHDLVHIITQPFRTAWGLVKDIWGNVSSFFGGVVDDIGNALGGIGGIFGDAFDAAGSVVQDVVNAIIDTINFFIEKIGLDSIGHVNFSKPESAGGKPSHGFGHVPGVVTRGATGGRVGVDFATGGRVRGGRRGFSIGGTLTDIGGEIIGHTPIGEAVKLAKTLASSGDAVKAITGLMSLPSKFLEVLAKNAPWLAGLPGSIGGKALDFVAANADNVPGDLFAAAKAILPGFAFGGHVSGAPGIDTIPAWLTRGEFVVTPDGENLLERMTGMRGILNWIGAMQGPATGYARGGRVGFAEGGRAAQQGGGVADGPDTGNLKGLQQILQQIGAFGSQTIRRWDKIWDSVSGRTKNAVSYIGKQIDTLQSQTSRMLQKMQQDWNREFSQIQSTTQKAMDKVSGYVKSAMTESDSATQKGLGYIVKATQKGLQAFDAKDKVDFTVPSPPSIGHASGGWVGNQGERGSDNVLSLLGRGEAVLNYAHQKIVNPALMAMYGTDLAGMFKSVNAAHGEQAAAGLASGGFTGPGHSGEGFTPVWNLAQQKFGMTYFTGFDGHSMMTTSGNVSDHFFHRALDMGNGILTPGENALNAFFKTKVPQVVKQLIWKAVDQFNGAYIGDHTDHVHLAMLDQYAFDQQRTAKILAAAEKGIDFSHLLVGGSAEGSAGFWKSIPEVKVNGTEGSLKSIIQASFDKLRDAANAYGEKVAGKLGSNLMGGIHEVRALPGGWKRVGATYEGLTGNTGAAGVPVGSGWAELLVAGANAGLWQQDLAATLGVKNTPGWGMGTPNQVGPNILVKRPNTLHAFEIQKNDIGSGQPDPYYKVDLQENIAKQLAGPVTQDIDVKMAARGGFVGQYAKGGAIDGGREGEPVGILAHVGEWVLNRKQQGRMAAMLGTSIDKLHSMLGFSGGPMSYAGGGEVKTFLHTLFLSIEDWVHSLVGDDAKVRLHSHRGHGVMDTAIHLFNEVDQALVSYGKDFRDKGAKLEDSVKKMFGQLTADGGILDQLNDMFSTLQTTMETALTKAQIDFKKSGRVFGIGIQGRKLIEKTTRQLKDQLDFLLGEKSTINTALDEAYKALKIAKRKNDKDAQDAARAAINNLIARQRDINSTIAQTQQSILDQIIAKLQFYVDKVTQQAANLLTGFRPGAPAGQRFGIQVRQGVLQSLGFGGQALSLGDNAIDVMQNEQDKLRTLLKRALRHHDRDLARDLEGQIADLQQSIADATAQLFNDTVQRISDLATRAMGRQDIRDRIAAILTASGQTVRGAQLTGQTLRARSGILTGEIADLQAQLAAGIKQGLGPDVLNPLRDQILDLQTQLKENAEAQKENTIAIRQARIDNITNRQGFLGGVSGGLTQILQTVGGITGIVNTAAIIKITQEALAQLIATGKQLREQLIGFGKQNNLPPQVQAILNSLVGLHGQDFVTAISGLNMNAIINSLGGPASPLAQQFEALIQALIDNEQATQDNTQATNDLKQQTKIQSFTSTAWSWFRQAIFNGMGGLMPGFQSGTPFFQEGGEMTHNGLAFLHQGEYVAPKRYAALLKRMVNGGAMANNLALGGVNGLNVDFATRRAATIQGEMAAQLTGGNAGEEYKALRKALVEHGNINVEVNEAEPGTDPVYLANKIAFQRKVPTT